MGGRGASGGGIAGGRGGGSGARVLGTRSLVSEREVSRDAVDLVLTTLRSVNKRYGGATVEEAQIAKFDKRGAGIMAYYDNKGNIAVNERYFDVAKMDATYDDCVKAGFHPGRGNKSGLEATTAHEAGHMLTEIIGRKAGYGDWAIDKVANEVVKEAAKQLGYGDRTQALMNKVSRYGASNPAEALAEAFADYYCNGMKAGRESRVIYSIMRRRLSI